MWTPSERCTPEQLRQMKQPRLADALRQYQVCGVWGVKGCGRRAEQAVQPRAAEADEAADAGSHPAAAMNVWGQYLYVCVCQLIKTRANTSFPSKMYLDCPRCADLAEHRLVSQEMWMLAQTRQGP
eukprot:350631-Chlamydomonas_euryale.AAC.15